MAELFAEHTSTIRNLISDFDADLSSVVSQQNIEEVFAFHDDWNGGTDYYNVRIVTPIDIYRRLKDTLRFDEAERKLKEAYDNVLRGSNGSVSVNKVFLVPKDDNSFLYPDYIDGSMWKDGFYRLFVSHISANKDSAMGLKQSLIPYGIDCFVAHADIVPSKEWENEIEHALFTMDSLCAIVVEDFSKSQWCDQEVGMALGQKKMVFAINKGAIPYGFIAKFQAIKGKPTCGGMAKNVCLAIANNNKTKDDFYDKFFALIQNVRDISTAKGYCDKLLLFNIEQRYINKLRTHFHENEILMSPECIKEYNKVFVKYGLDNIQLTVSSYTESDSHYDDLPF